jgi:hypothetical protein
MLVAGSVVFWAGAVTPPYRQWMGVPIEEYLAIVGAHTIAWRVMHGLFALGAVITLAGASGLTGALGSAGERVWAAAPLGPLVAATALWLVQVGFRLSVTPWASDELARTGRVPVGYVAAHQWMGVLFAIQMATSYLALAAYGVALLKTSLLPRWVGWTAFGFGALAIPGMATPVFQPPLMVYVVPFIIGVTLIRAT